jgi:ethanolamine utilization protein EutQ (cupin superfamily)
MAIVIPGLDGRLHITCGEKVVRVVAEVEFTSKKMKIDLSVHEAVSLARLIYITYPAEFDNWPLPTEAKEGQA